MKRIIKKIILLFLLLVTSLFLVSCSKDNLLEQLFTMDGRMESKGLPASSIEELEAEIAKYRKEVNDLVDRDKQAATYYKMLALKYIDKQMYKKALEACENAIELTDNSQNLFYLAGLCAGYVAKASIGLDGSSDLGANEKLKYFTIAEKAYLRAIEIEDNAPRPLYALSVLYIFELGRAKEAEPYLQKLIEVRKDEVDGRFLLARVYYETRRLKEAAELYDEIARLTKVSALKTEALANQKRVLEELYGKSE